MFKRSRKTALSIRLWLSDLDNLFFAVMILLHLIPIWSFRYFPSQDGPAHIQNAHIIREYFNPDYPIFRKFYVFNESVVPNWIGHFIMAACMFIVSPLVAEKILLTGYIVLLPVAVRYALRAIRPGAGFLAVLAFPFVYNYFLHMGFYNFSYSLMMFFFVVGYWLRHRERFELPETATLMVLGVLLYFSHLVSLVTALAAIMILAIWLTLIDLICQARRGQFNFPALWNSVRSRALAPLYAFLPALILAVTYISQRGVDVFQKQIGKLATFPTSEHVEGRLDGLLHLQSLISYNPVEVWFSTALVGLFAAVIMYLLVTKLLRRQVNLWDGLLLVVAAYVCIYFTAPKAMAGGGFIAPRMSLYPFFALILWSGAQSYDRLAKRGVQLIAAAIALIMLGFYTTKYVELNESLKEYLSGMHLVEPNTVLLPLCFHQRGCTPDGRPLSLRIGVFLHASGHIAAERNIVELENYEARLNTFPIEFRPRFKRPHLAPFNHIRIAKEAGTLKRDPSRLRLLAYPRHISSRVDYVLVWRAQKGHRKNAYFRRLRKNYDLIYTSPQRGFMQLYRRKDREK